MGLFDVLDEGCVCSALVAYAVVAFDEMHIPSPIMCDYEQFLFTCGHSPIRRSSYCHTARVDDLHQCFSVKVLKRVWQQAGICPDCRTQAESGARQELPANRG
ncbi:hypothetical protein VF21_09492 [Pseudogymnoascus sp. 05NY08]|nr:hypothetical protein VF21_09492 [Pseudogymnoascus sp. 05NY08]